MGGSVIKIEGLEKTLARFDKKNYEPQIQKCFNDFGIRTEAKAKQNAFDNAHDNGLLAGSIFFDVIPLGSVVGARANYAAYVEFGTGPFAAKYVKQLPIEWQKYALTFYKNGKGRLPAHPYLYPAFNITKDMLLKDLQAIKL